MLSPAKFLRIQVTSIVPLESWSVDDGTNDPWFGADYKWTITCSIDAQEHSYHLSSTPYEYNGLDVKVGDWVATSDRGVAVQITRIVSATKSNIVCEVEDIGRYNTFSDITASGMGIGPVGAGYIFELSDDGLPIISGISPGVLSREFQSDLLGRFIGRNLTTKFVQVIQESHDFGVNDVIAYDITTRKYISASLSTPYVVGIVRTSSIYSANHAMDSFSYEPFMKLVRPDGIPGTTGDIIYIGSAGLTTTKTDHPLYLRLDSNRVMLLSGSGSSVAQTQTVTNVAGLQTINAVEGQQVYVSGSGLYLYHSGQWISMTTTPSVSVLPVSVDVTTSTGSSVVLVNLTTPQTIRITIDVTTPFDDFATSLSIGTSQNNAAYLKDSDADMSVVGTYFVTKTSVSDELVLYFNYKTSTTGYAKITVSPS